MNQNIISMNNKAIEIPSISFYNIRMGCSGSNCVESIRFLCKLPCLLCKCCQGQESTSTTNTTSLDASKHTICLDKNDNDDDDDCNNNNDNNDDDANSVRITDANTDCYNRADNDAVL